MAFRTKLILSDEKFEQPSGSTLTLNGNVLLDQPITGSTQIVNKDYVDVKTLENRNYIDSLGVITGATNGLINQGSVVGLGGSLTGNTKILSNGNGFAFGNDFSDKFGDVFPVIASGDSSFSVGIATIAGGCASHATGCFSKAYGSYSHAEGNFTRAIGYASHSEGSGTFAVGNKSHAEGNITCATGIASHSEGGITFAVGEYSHAEGKQTCSIGCASHAEGFRTTASGEASHSGGLGSSSGSGRPIIASGNGSFNHSHNNTGQTLNYGALADFSTILGGLNHNIESGNTRAAIIGGNTIKLTGTTYIDTTAMSNLAIMSTPQAGLSGDTILVRDSSTGIIRQIDQSGVTGGGSSISSSDTEIIFNNDSALTGTSTFTFDSDKNALTVGSRKISKPVGQNSISFGICNCATTGYSMSMGCGSYATGLVSMAVNASTATGLRSFAANNSTSTNIGSASFNNSVASGCYSFAVNEGRASGKLSFAGGNFSCGVGDYSIVLGALSYAYACRSNMIGSYYSRIQSGNTRTTLVGGNGINLTGSTYNNSTVLGGSIAIYNTPSGGTSGDTILVRDSSTGFIRQINQSSIINATSDLITANNGLTKEGNNVRLGGLLTGNTVIEGGGNSFDLGNSSSKLSSFNLIASGDSIIESQNGLNIINKTTNDLIVAGQNNSQVVIKSEPNNVGGNTFNGSIGFNLDLNSNVFEIIDNRTGSTRTGIQYNNDYSLDYTNRSLVDKAYVDSVGTGLDVKDSVRVATTNTDGNIDLTGGTFNGFIDNLTVNGDDRVLIKNQTNSIENGIYIYSDLTVTFTRATDFDDDAEVVAGTFVFVETGNINASTGWVVSSNDPITVDTSEIKFSLFSETGVINGADGILKLGQNISVDLAVNSAMSFNGGKLRVDPSIAGQGLSFNNGVIDNVFNTIGLTGASNGLGVVNQEAILGGTLNSQTKININNYGIAIGGLNAIATGSSSIALGYNSVASGNYSFAAGRKAVASGTNSIAIGYYAYSTAYSSVAFSYGSATGNSSFAAGTSNAFGDCSIAMGSNSIALGDNSIALGENNTAFGRGSVAMGVGSNGNRNKSCGLTSFSFQNTRAVGFGDEGTYANFSTILGGCMNHISSGNTGATIIGGRNIRLLGTDYVDTTAVSNLAIIRNSTGGTNTDDVLVRDSLTGKIKTITQSSISSQISANNGLSEAEGIVSLGGTLTGDTTIDATTHDLILDLGTITTSKTVLRADIGTSINEPLLRFKNQSGNNVNTGFVDINIGTCNLNATTEAWGNIAIGQNNLQSINATGDFSGGRNVVAGYNAGSSLTTGNNNVLLGRNTLTSSQTGSYNVVGGYGALQNAGGVIKSSVAFGLFAASGLVGNNSYSVFIGSSSVSSGNNIGDQAIMIGNSVGGCANNIGDFNTFIGDSAARSACNLGESNTMIGVSSGRFSEGASNSTFIGRRAGWSIGGTKNTAIGYAAGRAPNSTGLNKGTTFTGNNSMFIGTNATFNTANASISEVIVIGNNFQASEANKTYLVSKGNVEIQSGHNVGDGGLVEFRKSGFYYENDYSATGSTNPRWIPDIEYITGLTSSVNSSLITDNVTTFTADTNNYVLLVDTSLSGQTITLPTSPIDGLSYKIKDTGNALTNNIIIDGNGNNIDSDTSVIINTDYGGFELVYDGGTTQWYILSFYS